jgi:hypothetical protein
MQRETCQPHQSFLALMHQDIPARAEDICHEAWEARQRSHEQRQTSRKARQRRAAARLERPLCRDHRTHLEAYCTTLMWTDGAP